MLWINAKIGTLTVMRDLFAGSLVSLLVGVSVPLGEGPSATGARGSWSSVRHGYSTLAPGHRAGPGLGGLLSVPVFQSITHLPPYMGMMLSLAVVWSVTDLVSRTMDGPTTSSTGVLAALKRVDVVAIFIGLISAVVDNVPLVAAGIHMYALPVDDPFWMMLAYCAGTGGSCWIIGSAAGVAAMGLEQIDLLFRKITSFAVLGYFSGMAVILCSAPCCRYDGTGRRAGLVPTGQDVRAP